VAITSSSDAKLARAKALGADLAVNYRTTPDWAAAIKQALGPEGIDIVVDVVGTGQLAASASLLSEGGFIAAIGLLDGRFSWTQKEIDGKPIVPIHVGNRARHEAMLAFAARHGIRPVIDVVYDLDRLADALHHLEGQHFFGKIGINLL
jgi:NADPH:quinone reductase-like Zn-dependent oxidoreductase